MALPTRHLKPTDALPVDRQIWKACAGSSVQLPPVHSLVYYFPQGHAEHADRTPAPFSARVYSTPSVRCRVLSVKHLARADTDEVYAMLKLMPVAAGNITVNDSDQAAGEANPMVVEEESVISFAKVLTSSDANNGGGFSMPKACAEIFPKLDFQADPPVQQLSMHDLQGKVWEFRHIYRGTPLRHLLTTGWSRFVNSKSLIHGDSVVFIHDTRNDTLFISVRRAIILTTNSQLEPEAEAAATMNFGASFSRRGLGKVPKDEVIKAAERAVAGEEFEIVFYPGSGFSNFLVNAELVDRTRRFPWSLNVKVKMNIEIEEPPRVGMVTGTVVAISGYDLSGMWDARSPWRMLKVHWNDPKNTKADEWISPWELEIDNPPMEAQRMPERMFNLAAAPPPPPRLNLTTSHTNAPNLGSVVHVEATNAAGIVGAPPNENINSGPARGPVPAPAPAPAQAPAAPASREHNALPPGSIKLFGKIISNNGST